MEKEGRFHSVCMVAVFLFCVALNASAGADGTLWRVVLLDSDTGAELWSAPARSGESITYAYVHSADKTPVESRLRVESPEKGFVVEQERYLWYGAGLEYRSDFGVGREDEWVVVDVERPLPRLVLRVAGTVEQRLVVGAEAVVIGDVASYGRRVTLEVRP